MMTTRRVKFIWGASKVVQGRWYLGLIGFYTREEGVPFGAIAVSVRGLLAWSGLAAALAYVAAATALFFVWMRNPYTLLSYTDALFYPVRRAEIAGKQGQAFIAEGLDALRDKKWQHGIMMLQQGLARFPKDQRARGALARIYAASHQRDQAARVLLEGLADEYPGRGYMAQVLTALEQMEDFEAVAETAARYLAPGRLANLPAERRWLTERRYAAFVAAGRHAEALAVAESDPEGEAGFERRVLSMLALGRTSDALRLLEAWREQPGATERTAVRLQVRALREAGNIDAMQAALARLRAMSPGDPAPLVYGIVQLALAGRAEAAAAALGDYLFRFGGSPENLLLAANPLAETGQLELLERCHAAANERGYPPGRFRTLLIELRIRRGEWAEAERLIAVAERDLAGAKPDPNAGAWLAWVRRLVDAATLPSDGNVGPLVEWIRSGAWPARIYRTSAEVMLRLEQPGAAHDIVTAAQRHFPRSPWLEKLAKEAGLLRMARATALPPTAESRAAPAERAFAQRLEDLVAARAWDDAARHIQQALSLRPAPAWLERQDPALRLAQVRIAQARADVPALSVAARLFLNGDEARSSRLLDLAGDFFTAGDRAAAVTLAREITRRSPTFAAAQRSLQEWAPAAGAASPERRAAAVTGTDDADLLELMRARQKSGDVPGLISATKRYLNSDHSRAERATAVAREFLAAGDKDSAGRVIREVLREVPGFLPAMRLQAELP